MIKFYERMILNRIAPTIELHLIEEHAGFRPGNAFTSNLLNITQHIQDAYQENMITGTAFIDMSAANDTVNLILCRRSVMAALRPQEVMG